MSSDSNALIEIIEPTFDDPFDDDEEEDAFHHRRSSSQTNTAPMVPFDIDESDIVENTNALGYDSNGRPRVSNERKLMIERNAKRRKRRPVVDPDDLYHSEHGSTTTTTTTIIPTHSSDEVDFDVHQSMKRDWWSFRPTLTPEIDIVRHKNGRLDLSPFVLPALWKSNRWIINNGSTNNSSGSMMFGTFVNAALCNDEYMKSYILNMLAFWHPLSAWWSSTSLEGEVQSRWDLETRVVDGGKDGGGGRNGTNPSDVTHLGTTGQWMTRTLKKWIRSMSILINKPNINLPIVRRRIIMMMGPKFIFSENVFGDESDEYNCLSNTPFGSWMCDDQNWMENLCNQSHLTPLSFMANFGRSICIQLTQPQTRREDALDVGLILLLIHIVSTHSSHLFNASSSGVVVVGNDGNDKNKKSKRLKSSRSLITRILRFRSFDLDDKDESDLGRTTNHHSDDEDATNISSSLAASGRMTPGGRITPSHRITKSQWIHDSMPVYRILTRTPVFVMLLIQCWRGTILNALKDDPAESTKHSDSFLATRLFECVCGGLRIWEPVISLDAVSEVKGEEGSSSSHHHASSSSPPISYNTHCTRIVDWFESSCDYLLSFCNSIFISPTVDISSYPLPARSSTSSPQSVIDESLHRMIVKSSLTLAKLEQILSSSSSLS
jgi:hypothetical protein